MSSTAGDDRQTRHDVDPRPSDTDNGTRSGAAGLDTGADTRTTTDTGTRTDADAHADTDGHGAVSAESFGRDRKSVVDREKEEYGGVKVGCAFFGWLTATGTVVLLSALLAAVGAVVGFNNQSDVAGADAGDAQTAGIVGAIVFLIVLFVAYFCGGYVAGRMARFNGLKQGVAVWVWALVIAVAVAILGAIAGDRLDVLAQLDSLPQIPVTTGDVTTSGIVALLAVAVASLVGAILGGLSGMRFHRKVDRAGLGR